MKTRIALILTALVMVFTMTACAPKETAAVEPEHFETTIQVASVAQTPAAQPVPQAETINWDDYADVIAAEDDLADQIGSRELCQKLRENIDRSQYGAAHTMLPAAYYKQSVHLDPPGIGGNSI